VIDDRIALASRRSARSRDHRARAGDSQCAGVRCERWWALV